MKPLRITGEKKAQSISTIIKDERHGKHLMNLVMALSFMSGKCLGVIYQLNCKSPATRSLPQVEQQLQGNKSPNELLQKQVPMVASVSAFHVGSQLYFCNMFPCFAHFDGLGFHQRAILDYFWRKLNQKVASRGTVKAIQLLQPVGPDKLIWSKAAVTYTAQLLGPSAPTVFWRCVTRPTLPPESEIYPSKGTF